MSGRGSRSRRGNDQERSAMRCSIVILGLLAATASAAGPPPREALPADLALAPADTLVFLSLRPAALLTGEVGRDLRQAGRLTTMNLHEWLAQASHLMGGIPLSELERVAMIGTPKGTLWLFTSTRAVSPQSVLATAGIKG